MWIQKPLMMVIIFNQEWILEKKVICLKSKRKKKQEFLFITLAFFLYTHLLTLIWYGYLIEKKDSNLFYMNARFVHILFLLWKFQICNSFWSNLSLCFFLQNIMKFFIMNRQIFLFFFFAFVDEYQCVSSSSSSHFLLAVLCKKNKERKRNNEKQEKKHFFHMFQRNKQTTTMKKIRPRNLGKIRVEIFFHFHLLDCLFQI